MRNTLFGSTAPSRSMASSLTATASSSGGTDLLLLGSGTDAYGFQRSGSTESTEAVGIFGGKRSSSCFAPSRDLPAAVTAVESRGVPVSPKKLPPTPPRENYRQRDTSADHLVPPSSVQQPRLFRSGGGGAAAAAEGLFRRPHDMLMEREEEAPVFRDSCPLLMATASGSPLSREHPSLYAIQRSMAFDDDDSDDDYDYDAYEC